ncbi:hypothetical protein ACFQ4L_09950 [Lapidilactobacillus mulanensis]|uniref:Uncharacterized protein n=1 Tax=Lapidilactobacillus mulanensis TaxID=2485999 RepID=A0ABW4DNZ8_9LACO|nr:hypothetical protein [Lapidilactobacillus mulanensis]
MTVYYLLNQNQSGINSQFIFDEQYHPLFLLTGQFGFGQGSMNLLTIDGDYLGSIAQTKNNFGKVFQLELNHQAIGQMRKLSGVWHQFAFVSTLNWTVMGSLTTNTYQATHGVHTVFSAEPTLVKKNLDGFKLSIRDDDEKLSCILVAATLNQWAINAQKKAAYRFNPFANVVPN